MKKNLIMIVFILLTIGLVETTSAINIPITYTADNVIQGWFQNGGSPIPFSAGSNAGNWQIADTIYPDLDLGHSYQIIWHVVNSDPSGPGPGNPGGFLAEIKSPVPLLNSSSLLSSASWQVAVIRDDLNAPSDFNSLTWQNAKPYGANNSHMIWYNVNGGPIAGISGAAQWIWWEANFGETGAPDQNDSVFIKAIVHPIPEPGTFLLFGTSLFGLLGIIQFRRKKR